MNFTKKLGSYPGILIIISLSVALFLIGFCGWIAFSSKELITYLKRNIEVQVFLDNNLSINQLDSLKTAITRLNIIELNDKNPQIVFISKNDAAKVFFEASNTNYKTVLEDNPFRDSFSIKIKESLINEKELSQVKIKLEKINHVYEVDYAKDFLKGVISNVNKIYKILSIIVLIFFIATLLLINNTIKLALYSQRFIIRTMQLVGATEAFIQKPFLLNGFFQGLTASIIAIILILLTKTFATHQIEGLSLLQNNTSTIILYALLIILGPLVGVLSTYQAISRYNKLELDKLY